MSRMKGVIAAIATPVRPDGEPDLDRFARRAGRLLETGCHGLNVLGTTGEATSFSVAQRMAIMRRAAETLPMDRLMVGTGAAAVADACALTAEAGRLGFAGALVLPPFYYKGVEDDGVVAYYQTVARASGAVPLYLYNFPAMSGVALPPPLVARLLDALGGRLAGLKDSSNDLDYARAVAALSDQLAVFPSNEAALMSARGDGPFAGCISATANLNAPQCGAAYDAGDQAALAQAVAIRGVFEGLPLVPAVKFLVGEEERDPEYARVLPPLTQLSAAQQGLLNDRLAEAKSASRPEGDPQCLTPTS